MKRAVLLAFGGYAFYAVLMVVLHTRAIYPFLPFDTVLAGFSRTELLASNGVRVGVQQTQRDGPIVLYFMGNGGALAAFDPPLQAHRAAGRHVIAMEYRGGGGRPGHPSEKVLKSDALLVADWALAKGRPVVVHGYSLGTGLAVHVARHRDVAQVVLEAPFDRLCIVMARRSFLPACWLPGVQKWDTLADAGDVSAPVLILHGRADQLIVPDRSLALVDAFPNAERLVLDGAGHMGVFRLPEAQQAVTRLFNRVRR